MIDENKTFEMFGYYSSKWSLGSQKPCWTICSGCGFGRKAPIRVHELLCHKCSMNTPECKAKMRSAKCGKWSGDDNPNYGGKINIGRIGVLNANWRGGAHSDEEIKEYNRIYRDNHPIGTFLGQRYKMVYHNNAPDGYLWHHTCYDHADFEANIVLMSIGEHTALHNNLRAKGKTIPHINEV